MNALSRYTPADPMTAEVIAEADGAWIVLRAGEEMPARAALSCLVQPEPGDLVLLGGEAPYILAVLERRSAAPVRLRVQGDLEITADGGDLRLGGDRLVLGAAETHVTSAATFLTGASVTARVRRLLLVADAIETIATRLLSRVKRSFRFVEETEQLRAADIDHRASRHLHLRGETAIVQANVVVKVDAKQIHMG